MVSNPLNRDNPVLIMGNGPSAKLIDYQRIEQAGFATVGMNAAYRFWDRLDFRPTYYICMDSVLIKSHLDRIFELVEEGRVQRFFLRDEYREIFPQHAQHPRILWFSELRAQTGSLFDTNMITTGSWALRWMAHEGHQHIGTIGIDANYVELLKEAKRLGDGKDLRLELAATPHFNPNYFFADYQQKGDQYNVPNSPDYLKATGQLVHVDALKRARDDIARQRPAVRISDCSPIATHGVFSRCSLDRFLSMGDLSVVTSFYEKAPADDLLNGVAIAVDNADNPLLEGVSIVYEGRRDRLDGMLPAVLLYRLRQHEATGRVRFIEVDRRPNYHQLFSVARKCAGQLFAVANADILFTREMAIALGANFSHPVPRLMALTRWNETACGLFIQGQGASPPWPQKPVDKMNQDERNYLSFDAYVFNRGLEPIEALQDIHIGTFGCDTAIAAAYRLAGVPVVNPCLSYRIVHRDDKLRDYSSDFGTRQMLQNTEAIFRRLQALLSEKAAFGEPLAGIDQLRPSIVSVGTPMHRHGPRHAFFRMLGTVPWSHTLVPQRVEFVRFEIDPANTSDEDLKVLARDISQAMERHAFLEIEVAGNNGDHYLGSVRNTPDILALKERLRRYNWQSVLYKDKASLEELGVHADLLLVARQLLVLQDSTVTLPRRRLGGSAAPVLVSSVVPRVLFLDSTPIGHSSATGQIKKVFLGDWPAEELMQIWQDGGVKGALKPIRFDAEGRSIPIQTSDLMQACRDFAPEVVYLRPIDSEPLLDLALSLCNEVDASLVVHMMDDWPSRLAITDAALAARLEPKLRILMERAALHLSISKKMSDVYAQRYGKRWLSLANGVDVRSLPARDWQSRKEVSAEAPFVLRYMGGMAPDMNFASVCDVARVVSALSARLPLRLEIHTMPWYLDKARAALKGLSGVQINELVEQDDYASQLASADALLIAYNFDELSITYTGLSLANKLPECLAAGVPVLGYGPPEVATIEVLRGTGGGVVVDKRDPQALTALLERLVSCRSVCERLGALGREYAARRLRKTDVEASFAQLMRAAADAKLNSTCLLMAATPENQPSTQRANKLFREGKYIEALHIHLELYSKRRLNMDRRNAIYIAKKIGELDNVNWQLSEIDKAI